jgi:renalase
MPHLDIIPVFRGVGVASHINISPTFRRFCRLEMSYAVCIFDRHSLPAMEAQRTCLIVGAGISGLMAAYTLTRAGCKVTVIDKSRGVGGRMATRRLDRWTFDHGAQYLSARNESFRVKLRSWWNEGLIRPWMESLLDGSGNTHALESTAYAGLPSMTSIPKAMASGLHVALQERVLSARITNDAWSVDTDTDETYMAEALLLTAPLPQSLAILEAGGVNLPSQLNAELEDVSYDPCFALLVGLSGPGGLPPPGAIQVNGDVISWIADNHQKGVSSAPGAITIHASSSFSREHLEAPESAILQALTEAAHPYLASPIESFQLHRWRYSTPKQLYPLPAALGSEQPPLVFAGDVFGTGGVEGAALSGIAAAELLLERCGASH